MDELKYLGWYVLSAKSFKVSLHHLQVQFFKALILYMLKAIE